MLKYAAICKISYYQLPLAIIPLLCILIPYPCTLLEFLQEFFLLFLSLFPIYYLFLYPYTN